VVQVAASLGHNIQPISVKLRMLAGMEALGCIWMNVIFFSFFLNRSFFHLLTESYY